MKNLFLLVLFLTSTLFAFSQTYPTYKSDDNTVLFQRTSSTTATLKFENARGIIVTEYLKNRKESATTGFDYSTNGKVITYTISDGGYVKLYYMGEQLLTTTFFQMCHTYDIEYYNELDKKVWSELVYTKVESSNATSPSKQPGSITKISSTSNTQQNIQQTGCISGDCNNGVGTYKFTNGNSYLGDWVNGVRSGFGEFRWADDGTRYIGEWQNGQCNGKGKLTLPDGTVKEGYFENGVFKGVQNTTTTQPTTPQPTTTQSFSFGGY